LVFVDHYRVHRPDVARQGISSGVAHGVGEPERFGIGVESRIVAFVTCDVGHLVEEDPGYRVPVLVVVDHRLDRREASRCIASWDVADDHHACRLKAQDARDVVLVYARSGPAVGVDYGYDWNAGVRLLHGDHVCPRASWIGVERYHDSSRGRRNRRRCCAHREDYQ